MESGQLGAKPVMQVTPQTAALFFASRNQLLARTLQVNGQLQGVGGYPYLPGKVFEQAAVGGRKGFARAWADDQSANRFTLVGERQLQSIRRG